MKLAKVMFGMALVVALSGTGAWAQGTADTKTAPDTKTFVPETRGSMSTTMSSLPIKTFYLQNVSSPADANEILTTFRNIFPPATKVYLVPWQNAVVIQATPEQLVIAQRLIDDLDRPKKKYRLTYTITEMDGGKRVGVQHYSMIAVSGQRVTLKQGSKVPIATGSYNAGGSGGSPAGAQTQFTYVDLGMNFDATPVEVANGAVLKSKVEQSAVAEQISIAGVQEPLIRQSILEGTSVLTLGKPLMLGSMDVPGSTRHLDVEVEMEQVP